MIRLELFRASGAGRLFPVLSAASSAAAVTPAPTALPPQRLITFVGAADVGKSTTVAALMGCRASPGGPTPEREFIDGYRLGDTPGLLGGIDYSHRVWDAIAESELVIFVATAELFRPEREMVAQIADRQRGWDREAGPTGSRGLALYVNKRDVWDVCLLPEECIEKETAVREQVAAWIPPERVVFGAAAPTTPDARRRPRIAPLQALILAHIHTYGGVRSAHCHHSDTATVSRTTRSPSREE